MYAIVLTKNIVFTTSLAGSDDNIYILKSKASGNTPIFMETTLLNSKKLKLECFRISEN